MKKSLLTLALTLMLVLCLGVLPVYAVDDVPAPLDPQSWQLQREMTWDDLKPNPVIDWLDDTTIIPEKEINALLLLVDFKDMPFILTQPQGSDLLGNPVVPTVAREDLAAFFEDYLNTPSELNHELTIDGYWKENSYGKWSIDVEAFGPYTMPYYEFEYGLTQSMNDRTNSLPPGFDSTQPSLQRDAYNTAKASGDPIDFDAYDFIFVIHAGYDESCIWQTAGEMMFESQDEVAYEFSALARLEAIEAAGYEVPAEALEWARENNGQGWAKTRYQPWSSWFAAAAIWSGAGSVRDSETGVTYDITIQGESTGMGTYAHEFGHVIDFADNYNSGPYANPPVRAYSGPWELMSRGCMIGPGGVHDRYSVPGIGGEALATNMMTRQKVKTGFIVEGEDMIVTSSDDLKNTTPLVVELTARNVPLIGDFAGGLHSITINYTEMKPQDTSWNSDTWRGDNWYDHYTVEVVDQTGYDSFLNDHGVLIAKNRTQERAPFTWVIDAFPEDIDLVDFVRADGTTAMISKGDQYQLADAAFHAGVSEGVVNEYADEWNNLHFYILDKKLADADYGDVLSYQVGIRHTEGQPVTGELQVQLAELEKEEAGKVAVQWVNIVSGGNAEDIYRLDVSSGLGWDITILNNFYALGEFEHVKVPIYISIPEGAQIGTVDDFDLTITVSSESNSARSHSVTVADIGNTVIAGTEATPVEPLASISAPSEVYLDGSREIHYVVSVDDIQRAGAFVLEGQFDLNRLDYIGTEVNLADKHEAFAYELADAYDAATGRYWLPIVLRGDDFRTYEEAALLTIKFKVKDSFGDESLYQNVTGNLNWMEVTLLDVDREATEVLATIVKGSADTMISKKGLKYDINKDDKYTMADIVMIMDRYYKVNSDDAAWADAVTYDIVADGEINTGDLVAFLDLLYK